MTHQRSPAPRLPKFLLGFKQKFTNLLIKFCLINKDIDSTIYLEIKISGASSTHKNSEGPMSLVTVAIIIAILYVAMKICLAIASFLFRMVFLSIVLVSLLCLLTQMHGV